MAKIVAVIVIFLGIFKLKQEKSSSKPTLRELEEQMSLKKFSDSLIGDLLVIFQSSIDQQGEKTFWKEVCNLHYSVPKELKDENTAAQLYKKYSDWFEKELRLLEEETDLPWEQQAEDLLHIKLKARKVQLVLRHRLTEIILELVD